MKINTYGDAVIIEDFLRPETLEAMQLGNYEIVETLKHEGHPVKRTRLQVVNEAFNNELAGFVQSTPFRETVSGWPDLSWRCIASRVIRKHESHVSIFEPGDCMEWHIDHMNDSRVSAFFLPLNEPGGGELVWNKNKYPIDGARPGDEFDADFVLAPKINRLCIIPSWYPHRSMPCEGQRLLLHGHLNT